MKTVIKPLYFVFRNILSLPLLYSSVIILGLFISSGFREDITPAIHSPLFYTGLALTLFLNIYVRLPQQHIRKINKYILLIVPIIVLSIGFMFISLAYLENLWEDPPFVPSVFGAGVSIIAIGLALVFAFYPLINKQNKSEQREITQRPDMNINKLSSEADRIEKIAKDCKNLSKKLSELKEGKNNKDTRTKL